VSQGFLVNDVHSQLNSTRVHRIVTPLSLKDLVATIDAARRERLAVCVSGSRHAMGGQAFATDAVMLDMRGLNRVLAIDRERGLLEVEAGIQWPELLAYLDATQAGAGHAWTFAQKQTGADRLTLGGCLAANVHGRGLRMTPFVGDVESFTLVDAAGRLVRAGRTENAELFRLAIGGYGLFGPIYSVTLRLVPRRLLQRVVEVIDVEEAMGGFDGRIANGFLYGDFQFATDASSPDFLRRGVFSCYRPVPSDTPVPQGQKELSAEAWRELLYLAHADKSEAFRRYATHYLSTSGQIYRSDAQQMSYYPEGYHAALDARLRALHPASEMITEIYVPRDALVPFFEDVRRDFRSRQVNLIYGTVRLIEPDDETFLAWAREAFACVIFNLHVEHTREARYRAAGSFRHLIDLGIRYGGSYYLTYHRYAARRQVERCYPRFPEFLRLKRTYDPGEFFQSEWYRHYRQMFA
jgi:FAD/FMN-containing dehydrogenase